MTETVNKQFWQVPRFKRRIAIFLFVSALVCAVALTGAGRISMPIALVLVGILLWIRSRPYGLNMEGEISESIHQWMTNVEDDPEMKLLHQAFRDYFQGVNLLPDHSEDAMPRLRVALASFDKFFADDPTGPNERHAASGLLSSAALHRAKAAFHLAASSTDVAARMRQFRSILHGLVGFEDDKRGWPMLVMPAIALRIELHLGLGEIDEAEADQEILDRYVEGSTAKPEILATRRALADAMWEAAAGHSNEETASGLRFRALIHYDEWLRQVGSGDPGARLIVAQRNSELEQGTHVIDLLADVIDDHDFTVSVGRSGLLNANRLLARAYLQNEDYNRALRHYSVLMSVVGDANPYLGDVDVLREIEIAEARQERLDS